MRESSDMHCCHQGARFRPRKELDGGTAPGEDSFRWIVNQVREAEVAAKDGARHKVRIPAPGAAGIVVSL